MVQNHKWLQSFSPILLLHVLSYICRAANARNVLKVDNPIKKRDDVIPILIAFPLYFLGGVANDSIDHHFVNVILQWEKVMALYGI